MINLTYLHEGADATLFLADRIISGTYVSANWGVIVMKDNIIAGTDGEIVENSDREDVNIADVLAFGNTGTRRHIKRRELCWELDILDYEINYENKFTEYK